MQNNNSKKQSLVVLMLLTFVFQMIPVQAFAVTTNKIVKVSKSSDLPETIEKGVTYELSENIVFEQGKQIKSIEGVLDGKGYTITLSDKPLANNVSGTIQNLGLLGSKDIKLQDRFGSMANKLSGSILNSYSLVNISPNTMFDEIAGLVGTLEGGKIYNSYHAGSNSAMFSAGLVVFAKGGEIKNSYFTTGSAFGMQQPKPVIENVSKKTIDEMKQATIVTSLNKNIKDTGYTWILPENGGFPILTFGKGSNTVNKKALELKISEAEKLVENQYISSTWDVFKVALSEAKEVVNKSDVKQEDIDLALEKLENAMGELEKKRPLSPVEKPLDEEKIIHLKDKNAVENIGMNSKDKYYILDSDITLDSSHFNFDTFEGVFDGNGHTITFDKSYSGLFNKIGKNGVVQNTNFKGSITSDSGAVALEVEGAVINSYTEVTGEIASGFAKRLNNGVISNSYSISTAKGGVIINQTSSNDGNKYTGILNNVYWDKELKQPIDLSQLTIQGNTGSKTSSEMKTMEFVDQLNSNRGIGTKWGQNSNGYPYFGENQDYSPEGQSQLPANKTKIDFTYVDENESKEVKSQKITLDNNKSLGNGKIGKFSLPDYKVENGSEIEWSTSNDKAAISKSGGELFVYKEGDVIITATLIKADGSRELLASVNVNVVSPKLEDIKLYLLDVDSNEEPVEVVNGKATIDGSEFTKVIVKAKYKNEEGYNTISSNVFSFEFINNDNLVNHMDNSSSFYFKEPGKATIKVTANSNKNIAKQIEIESKYVPVESIHLSIQEEIVIHGRNPNSPKGQDFLQTNAGIVVEPANASYRSNVTIESSDPSIGEYIDSMVKGYVAHKAGTVTYTASILDNGTKKTGSKTVKYIYKNPLKNILLKSNDIVVKSGEILDTGITFEGTLKDGHEITETGMIWTFDRQGIASILRSESGFKYDESAPDRGMYFLGKGYKIKAISPGVVTITGTPIDKTSTAKPISFTVTVLDGDRELPNLDTIMNNGINTSVDFLNNQIEKELVFGNEWDVITLLRSGTPIGSKKLDMYYNSVVEEVKGWNTSKKPTEIERVALAMASMDKDITNIDGVNLAELIYNNNKIDTGSNEAAFALLALDAVKFEIPSDAKWNRESMIKALLTFQNEEKGFFGLFDNKVASTDLTAMSVQALAPYRHMPEVSKAIDKALDYLRSIVSVSYDFDDNSNSTAQVFLALAVLDIDPTYSENGFGNMYDNIVTRLNDYKANNEPGFAYVIGGEANAIATTQVMQAFDAYQKSKEGINYWDFTVKTPSKPNNPVTPGKPDNSDESNGSQKPNGSENQNDLNGSINQDNSGDKVDVTPQTGDKAVLPFMMFAILSLGMMVVFNRRKIS